MIGIYKIISPSKKIYVGQSIDIEKRFEYYKILNCKGQTILYNSFLKYGVNNHTFAVLCECDVSELNEKERFYQDLFSVLKNGMNCMLTSYNGNSGKMCVKTRLKLSIASKGKKMSKESKLKMSLAKKGCVPWNKNIRQKEATHGTIYEYNLGCRCYLCKSKNTEYCRNKKNKNKSDYENQPRNHFRNGTQTKTGSQRIGKETRRHETD